MGLISLIARAPRALSIMAGAWALVMALGAVVVKVIAPALALAFRLVVAFTLVAVMAIRALLTCVAVLAFVCTPVWFAFEFAIMPVLE